MERCNKCNRPKRLPGHVLTMLCECEEEAGQHETIVMLPYAAHDHSNRHKVHIQEVGKDTGSLCGFYHGSYASGLPFMGAAVVDEEWLNQADPDHEICLHCKKIAAKKLAT